MGTNQQPNNQITKQPFKINKETFLQKNVIFPLGNTPNFRLIYFIIFHGIDFFPKWNSFGWPQPIFIQFSYARIRSCAEEKPKIKTGSQNTNLANGKPWPEAAAAQQQHPPPFPVPF
jgi:hypothetical protein